MAIDRYDWHYDSAAKLYCEESGKSEDHLAQEDYSIIEKRAAAHIGCFIRWLIMRDRLGTDGGSEEFAAAVKSGDMTGTDYLMNCCDGKFWDDDVAEDSLPFVTACYDKYIALYEQTASRLTKRQIYTFEETDELYSTVEGLIDKLYDEYSREASNQ